MFDDFHETTRNAGIVGILLGLLVLAGFCGLGMAVWSGLGQKKGPSMEELVSDQTASIQNTKNELEVKKAELEEIMGFRKAADLVKEKGEAKQSAEGRTAELEDKVLEMQGEIDEAQLNFEEYRQKYRDNERKIAVGEILDLSETKGESFEKCKVLAVSPLHLRVMRSAGPIGIPYQELPSAIQDRFQFDQDEAEAYQNKVDASLAKRDQGIKKWREDQKKLKGEAAGRALVEKIAATKKAYNEKVALAARLDASAQEWNTKAQGYDRQAASARAAGRISSATGHASQARGKATSFTRQAANARLAAKQLLDEEAALQALVQKNGQ